MNNRNILTYWYKLDADEKRALSILYKVFEGRDEMDPALMPWADRDKCLRHLNIMVLSDPRRQTVWHRLQAILSHENGGDNELLNSMAKDDQSSEGGAVVLG